ncbi:FIG001385: N-acetylmuramoyl-L-alanine amidase [hydrothermal vent metagenome]|uniref:N-acetylmuramoyl-L-alanine amidase n=1 Tax=hydrothermal vent metagenome TaxID=652676 RepID=A0A3B0S6L1_9ZZZZ
MIRTKLPHTWCPSANFGERKAPVDLLLMHYTGMKSGAAAVNWLCNEESGVSCHYLVDVDGAITQMVCESKRAWHAGKSCWQGVKDINSCSVGIEVQNAGPSENFPDFPDVQMAAVIELSKDIITRHAIELERVLGHSDVAPGRKIDPGEKFPWELLAVNGVGVWPRL